MMGAGEAEGTAEVISRQVAGIMAMGQGELETAWGRHCRGKPPAGLPRSLLAACWPTRCRQRFMETCHPLGSEILRDPLKESLLSG